MVEDLRGYIGLGSNLGDRLRHLQYAAARLATSPGFKLLRASGVYESPAQGFDSPHAFLNAVVEIGWQGEPLELGERLLQIERLGGREREPAPSAGAVAKSYADRTLDLDILWLHGIESMEPRLLLPHPRALSRAFVLLPWEELAPELELRGATIAQWAARLPLAERLSTKRVAGAEWAAPPR